MGGSDAEGCRCGASRMPRVARGRTHLFHGDFLLGEALPGELGDHVGGECQDAEGGERSRVRTSSKKALVNAWMRNLKGRKSGDSSSRCIFLAMSVWWIGSPLESVASTVEHGGRAGWQGKTKQVQLQRGGAEGRAAGRQGRRPRVRTVGTDRIQKLEEDALNIGPILLRHLVSVARRATTLV